MNVNQPKHKIAFHATGATSGGLATFIRHLSKGFIERGHTVQFLCDSDGPFLNEMSTFAETYLLNLSTVVIPGLKFGPIRVPHPVAAVKTLVTTKVQRNQTEKTLIEANPDIVLGNGLGTAASFGTICKRNNIKLVQCVHGIGTRDNDFLALRSRLSARLLNQADSVVGVSNACLERYQKYLKIPSETIYNCCPVVKTSSALREEFTTANNLPENVKIIGSFGRIQYKKGYQIMLEAVAKRSLVDRKIAVVVGGAPANSQEEKDLAFLKRRSVELGIADRCFFTGNITPERLFSILDVFCHSYLGDEALSYAILEAMSAGCPTIAVNRGGPKEIIQDESLGQLVPMGDANALEKAIVKYLDHPDYTAVVSKNGLKRISDTFNYDDWPNNWLDVFGSHLNC